MTLAKHIRLSSLTFIVLSLFVFLASCSKKDVKSEDPLISPSGEGAMAPAGGGFGGEATGELKTVYFDFDQFNLRNDARATLKGNAKWLKDNESVSTQIAGHCDERGTTEYNLALGQRRANSVRDYYVRLGIDKSRLSTISYGEEQPISSGHDEAAWARNRRAEMLILGR